MKSLLLALAVFFCGWGCRQNTGATSSKTEEMPLETEVVNKVPKVIKELAKFAKLTLTDTSTVDNYFLFKKIDTEGILHEIDMDEAVKLYTARVKGTHYTSYPIFEIRNGNVAILPIKGVGFGGAIWGKVLVDKSTMEIKKIAFGHKAESEGYGAAMTLSSFENQFVGTGINLDANTFALRRATEEIKDEGRAIDVISGATMTSQGVIDMVNEGMKKYKAYLNKKS